jgi:hypothetical protein
MDLDYKWMSLDMMSKVYLDIPDEAPEKPRPAPEKSKSEIANKKKGGIMGFVASLNPFKNKNTE